MNRLFRWMEGVIEIITWVVGEVLGLQPDPIRVPIEAERDPFPNAGSASRQAWR